MADFGETARYIDCALAVAVLIKLTKSNTRFMKSKHQTSSPCTVQEYRVARVSVDVEFNAQ